MWHACECVCNVRVQGKLDQHVLGYVAAMVAENTHRSADEFCESLGRAVELSVRHWTR